MTYRLTIAVLMVAMVPALAHHFTYEMNCYSEFSNGCDISTTPTFPQGEETYWWTFDPVGAGVWDDFSTDVYWNTFTCWTFHAGSPVDLYSEVVGYNDYDAHLCWDCPSNGNLP
jgi:hypothetical protein